MSAQNKNSNHYIPPTEIHYIDGQPTSIQLRRYTLTINPTTPAQREVVFDKSTLSIGSISGNDLVISDTTLSRNHCRILQKKNNYTLLDLDSTNGTYINGIRIKEAFINSGCSIQLGNTNIKFHADDQHIQITPKKSDKLHNIIGKNIKMREIFGILEKISPTNATVIIEGETGTGKEVIARSIHKLSHRAKKQFMVFDCGAVPESLIESELFGHEKGSFTGAISNRQGIFELASGGTVFLDEIGELGLDMQPKLLRVLETRKIRRVGSNKVIPVDIRIIAATNRNLQEEVKIERFREDLFYRLSVVRLVIPPLRDRVEDIPMLVSHFLQTHSFNRGPKGILKLNGISDGVHQAMFNYHWPGNIRELLNIVERACSLSDSSKIELCDLPDSISTKGPLIPSPNIHTQSKQNSERKKDKIPQEYKKMTFKEAKEKWVSSFEEDYIRHMLEKNKMNISKASREAQIDRKYFRKLMKKYLIIR